MKIVAGCLVVLAGLTGGANASVIYTLTEGPTAVNSRTYAGTTDYTISPSYVPGGGDPRLTFSFTLATALAPSTTTTLIYRDIGGSTTSTQVLAFNYVGGGLGLNLSNDAMNNGIVMVIDGNGTREYTRFRASVTTDAAGVIQYYDFSGGAVNTSVPSLYTTFNVLRSVTNPVLSIGSGSLSLQYRFISGGASCAVNCYSPVFSEMAEVTIPGGGGNGGGGTGGIDPAPGGSTSVAEPSSALLLAAGLGLALLRRRDAAAR